MKQFNTEKVYMNPIIRNFKSKVRNNKKVRELKMKKKNENTNPKRKRKKLLTMMN